MTPIRHPHCNDVLRKPDGITEEECRDLHIRRDDGYVWSFWTPSPEELLAINRGGTVALAVMGTTHPPLMIHACHPHEAKEHNVSPDEYTHRMEALNGRLNRLLALTKKIVSAWTGNRENERPALTDRLLDMMSANRADGSIVEVVPADDAVEAMKGDIARLDAKLHQISDALGDEWNVMDFPEAITAIKNRLAMAEAGRDELRRWKAEQMAVEATWNPQAVGDALGIVLGAPIRENILPLVEDLKDRLAKAESRVAEALAVLDPQHPNQPES